MSIGETQFQLNQDQASFFDRQGYLIIEDALKGNQLHKIQGTSYRVEQQTQAEWRQAVANLPDFRPYGLGPTAHVVYPIINHDDIFLDLLEHPMTISIAMAFMGPDIQMIDNALHIKPAGSRSHTGWHRDAQTWFHSTEAWTEADQYTWQQMRACERPFFKIKIFFCVDDVNEETAPFSVVPGSHKTGEDRVPQYNELEEMPNHLKLVGKAGTAILWNGRIWHTAMHNTDTKSRRMLLFNYTHFGMKQHAPCVPASGFAQHVRNRSPLCRQLLGLERMTTTDQ
ncbi:TPA: hypothetical protein EYN09_15800 [Candidatus Poribacteria bacterium]|nr:hypothetical protein [Candidatus Poribacteria bacterium]HIB98498.1 hypothetical protein [Candidatus Poribacteria bacterium]HIN27511.1 hypothetical protein [Candidatus Poribacteria bacterium]HIO08375.1 hypothetical protein [Candidatus Poribacteria bacterium]HIO48598.1 hypothetical protein [Candidatus Poribacteria bacterium]